MMRKSSMFKEHFDIAWGTVCSCGNEVFILQNVHHPWDNDEFTIKIKCANCSHTVIIDREKATNFYNEKIYSYFDNVEGTILDLGCGGGFLSERLVRNVNVQKVIGLDLDDASYSHLEKYNFEFISNDISNLNHIFEKDTLDYLVSRDVFMYIEDTDRYFDDVTHLINQGIYQMGWYMSNHPRMKNCLKPDEIVYEYRKHGWETEIEYLDWYKSGYFIRAIKKN